MSKAGANNPSVEIDKLLAEVDAAVSLDDIGKEARLTDAKNNLTNIRADLVGLKRMLIQHPKPDVPVQELNGATIGATIRDKIKQAKRLEDYIKELEALPDDPEPEVEAEADTNGHKALQPDELSDTLEDEEEGQDEREFVRESDG